MLPLQRNSQLHGTETQRIDTERGTGRAPRALLLPNLSPLLLLLLGKGLGWFRVLLSGQGSRTTLNSALGYINYINYITEP